jgi:ABC-type multidrug transport system ATPase subunit
VSLEVPRGGCFALFGPNGAGKSTLLRVISTQWTPSEGRVEVLGMDVRRHPERVKARIGLVLHEPFLRRELTLSENLTFAGDLHGLPRSDTRARGRLLLERFGLSHRAGDLVRTFSQGMLKRASLARSLLAEPELWILDEPFSGLDPEGQAILERAIDEFAAGRGTVLLVTHQLSLGRRLASGSGRVEDGKVTVEGTAA